MAEPQPPTVREGASSPPPPTTAPAAPGTAEDRKAAAALSSLDARNDDDDAASAGRSVDAEALGKAMAGAGQAGGKGKAGEGPEVKKVKVEQADVALLVEHLELSKARATELLKAHDGDAKRAMIAYVTTSA